VIAFCHSLLQFKDQNNLNSYCVWLTSLLLGIARHLYRTVTISNKCNRRICKRTNIPNKFGEFRKP